jgi:hypothetical protein
MSNRPEPRRDRARTALPSALGPRGFWAIVATGLAALAGACTSSSCPEGEQSNGACSALCSDDQCKSGTLCVNNLCRPECDRNAEQNPCRDGDSCRRIDTDYGTRGDYCFGPERADDPYAEPTSTHTDCDSKSDCLTDPAQSCIQGLCVTTCLTHDHCGPAGSCTGEADASEGERVWFCEQDSFPHGEGQFGSLCLNQNADCDSAAGFLCLSGGEGDAESYCTQAGCAADLECPAGYFCQHTRLGGDLPCEDVCGVAGAPDDPECIPSQEIGPGKRVTCRDDGPGLELRLCAKRGFCNECEHDADCRSQPGQVCAQGPDGTRSCTQVCEQNASSCPWGAATDCQIYDRELNQPTCGHRSGTCGGRGNSCDPCVDDADCPTGFCTRSTYTGEQFCVALEDTCSCKVGEQSCVGGGCPMTPGGLEMNCVPRGEDLEPSACFGALTNPDPELGRFGCWPE